MPNTKVFFDITAGGQQLGRIVMEVNRFIPVRRRVAAVRRRGGGILRGSLPKRLFKKHVPSSAVSRLILLKTDSVTRAVTSSLVFNAHVRVAPRQVG